MPRFYRSNRGRVQFTEAEELEADAEEARFAVEQAATAYIRARQKGYPSVGDQLDHIYHYGLADWKAAIKAIKDRHPKP